MSLRSVPTIDSATWCRTPAAVLDVASDVHWLHGRDRRHAMMLAPGQELVHCLRVGPAGVAVADVGREEFDKPFLRAISGRGDEVGAPQVAMGRRAGSLIARSPPSSHTTPRRFEIDAAPESGLEGPNFVLLLGGF